MIGKDAVVERFGYWPEFCDAKLTKFEFDFGKNEMLLSLDYFDIDQGLKSAVNFIFEGVHDLLISELREGAVTESLTFLDSKGKILVQIDGVYGILGEFYCGSISTHMDP